MRPLTSGAVGAIKKCVCENRVDPCEAQIEVEPRTLQFGINLGGEKVGGVRVGGIRSVPQTHAGSKASQRMLMGENPSGADIARRR
jgi:hypothetical protein